MDQSEIRKAEIPMQVRFAPVGSADIEARTVEVVWARGAGVQRMDWWTGERYIEELSMDPKHIRMDRMNGGASVLASHNQWDLDAVIGVVDRASVAKGEGTATLRFADDEVSDRAWQKVRSGILRNVSVGYIVHRYQKTDGENGGPPVWRAIDWEPCEVSFVAVPADPGAQVRSAIPAEQLAKLRTFTCEFITPAAAAGSSSTLQRNQETTMSDKDSKTTVPAAEPNAGSKEPTAEQRAAIAKEERARVEGIRTRAEAQGLPADFYQPLIDDGKSLDEACRAMVDEVAKRKATAAPINPTRAEITEDERVKLRGFVAAALTHRLDPGAPLPNGAGEFRYMSQLRLAEEILTREGVRVKGMPPMEIARRSLLSTSDFPNILLDAANKRLRKAYEENIPSYTRWARRAPNAPDFKNINVVLVSGAPDLQKVLEGGEFKRGSMSDGKETYQIFTYGRIISYTRQALVNDDLSALDRTPRALGAAGRRLENRTVYGILTTNGNMADGAALFNANAYTPTGSGHANLGTGAGSALSTGSMATGRSAMRLAKGKQNEELNVTPAFLLVPTALEQTAYQLTSSQFVPATATGINEFRQGGRTAVDPIVEALLDANSSTAWYFAASPDQIDTVEYCYLEGSEGMSIESQPGFTIDGIDMKARLDFAAAPTDFRGLYKAVGA